MAGEKSRVGNYNNSLILAVILRNAVHPRPRQQSFFYANAKENGESHHLVHKDIVACMAVLVNGEIECLQYVLT